MPRKSRLGEEVVDMAVPQYQGATRRVGHDEVAVKVKVDGREYIVTVKEATT